ncbi:MAG TPA: ABC transporter ATP-binding protein [bacterium]|nr:ABC transporter ATP-binding protein [bacterium]
MSGMDHEAVISIRGLTKTFYLGFFRRKVEALRGVDLTVRPNEILGFLGPNGAGKTTTIKVLMGIIYPSSGGASILGAPVGDVKTKQRIGFLPEQPYFYDYLKGREFLDFYARIHGLKSAERKRRVKELMERVGVAYAADLPLRKYSKGMLQRVGLAQALLGDPEVVILDEPMSGLDPLGRRDIREIIFGLKEEGKTIFFSTHILPDVEQICDRVCIIHKGKIRDTGTLSEILKPGVEMVDLQFSDLDDAGAMELGSLSGRFPGLRVIRKGGLCLVSVPGWEAADEAERVGRDRGGRLVMLAPQKETLENFFLREIAEGGGKS